MVTVDVTVCQELIEVGILSKAISWKSTRAAGGRLRLCSTVAAPVSNVRMKATNDCIFAVAKSGSRF